MIPKIVNKGLRLCGFESFTESEEPPTEITKVVLEVYLNDKEFLTEEMDYIDGFWRKTVTFGDSDTGHCEMKAIAFDNQGRSKIATISGDVEEGSVEINVKFKKPLDGFKLKPGSAEVEIEASVTKSTKKRTEQ